MRLLILLAVFASCCFGLKCRSQEGLGEADLKRTVRSCMRRQDENEDRGQGMGRPGQGYDFGRDHEQDRDRDRGQGGGRNSYGNRWQRSLRQSENRNSTNGDGQGDVRGGGACVAQCFFEEMNMVDGNGLPDRRKVAYLLTKDLRDRELRNFLMDTVQQCFRYLETGGRSRQNKCVVSQELVKCMSEYAKAQCEDWEEHGNMLFN